MINLHFHHFQVLHPDKEAYDEVPAFPDSFRAAPAAGQTEEAGLQAT